MAAPIITIFKNGDTFHNGKRLVLNRKEIRNFDAFLDRVTKDTRSQVAVRSIRTPSHGHRVSELDKLENGGIYVAVGPEKFKKLEYKELSSLPTHKPKPVEQFIKPVVHSRVIVSGRARKVAAAEPSANKTIFVFRNGDDKHPSFKIHLDKRTLHTGMDTILQFITEKVRLRTGAVKSLYTLDGIEVLQTSQIKPLEKYVAVGFGKKFLKMAYNENGASSLTPRRVGPKVKSTSSEPLSRKKRPRPPVKAMSQGHVKSPSRNEKVDLEKENSLPDAGEEIIGDAERQNENESTVERGLTHDLPNTMSRASTKNEAENAVNSNEANPSRKNSVPAEEPSRRKSTAKENGGEVSEETPSLKRTDSKADEEANSKVAVEEKRSESKRNLKKKPKEKTKRKSTAGNAESKDEMTTRIADNESEHDATVFKATGDQGEQGVAVKDNEETNVEEPLDMLPAEEVEEEIESNVKDTRADNEVNDATHKGSSKDDATVEQETANLSENKDSPAVDRKNSLKQEK